MYVLTKRTQLLKVEIAQFHCFIEWDIIMNVPHMPQVLNLS